MPQLRTKQELANSARAFAVRYKIVEYQGNLYMPVHFITRKPLPKLTEETVWIPLSERKLRGIANLLLNILFATDSEERSFTKMVKQFSKEKMTSNGILVRIKTDKVMLLNDKGKLVDVKGKFVANYMDVPYDPETPLADELYKIIVEWVGNEAQAASLLHHIATALQSKWSAVRYVLLLGSGRNGKSTLLKMVKALFGPENVSGVKRQDMAANSTIMTSLNGKLLNIVMDGPKEFLKDSSTEKTLIAGEPLDIELKYENAPFTVQTNALFMEGLQHEPRVSDKSPALQKRLVRFHFPNEYPLNHDFEARMLDEKMLAAFLHLLLLHWVNKSEVHEKLRLTAESLDMQTQAVWAISPVLRFLEWQATRDVEFLQSILTQKMMVETFMLGFRTWSDANGYKTLEDDYLLQQLQEYFTLDRKTFRVAGKPSTRRYIKSATPDTLNAIETLLSGERITEPTKEEQEILQALDD